jgi:hypothetical protein
VESKKVSAQNRGKSCHVSAHQHLRKVDSRPELRIPAVAAQTRMVSVARIRLDFRKSVGLFKAIICDDILSSSPRCPATQSGLRVSSFEDAKYLCDQRRGVQSRTGGRTGLRILPCRLLAGDRQREARGRAHAATLNERAARLVSSNKLGLIII